MFTLDISVNTISTGIAVSVTASRLRVKGNLARGARHPSLFAFIPRCNSPRRRHLQPREPHAIRRVSVRVHLQVQGCNVRISLDPPLRHFASAQRCETNYRPRSWALPLEGTTSRGFNHRPTASRYKGCLGGCGRKQTGEPSGNRHAG